MKISTQKLSPYVAVLAVLVLAWPSVVLADSKSAICEGVTDVAGSCSSGGGLNTTITTFINLLSTLAGIIAVVMLIIGGYKYMTSNGDSSKVASAKTTVLYAIIGLIIAVLSQIIAKFVLKNTT